jgi:hypothetical protein
MIQAVLAALGIYIKTYMFANFPIPPPQKYINLRGLAYKQNFCACSVIDTAYTKYGDEKAGFFREYEAEFKKTVDQGPRGIV